MTVYAEGIDVTEQMRREAGMATTKRAKNSVRGRRGDSTEDRIFEALIHGTFYTVSVSYELDYYDEDRHSTYNFRVRNELELKEGDLVLVEGSTSSESYFVQAVRVIDVHESPNPAATAWVVDTINLGPHLDRQEQWKELYQGICDNEIQKRKEALTDGYAEQLKVNAPGAAKVLEQLGVQRTRSLPKPDSEASDD